MSARFEELDWQQTPMGEITLRRLMSHTAGIPPGWALPGQGSFEPVTRAQVIQSLNQKPFLFTPGTGWSYSNAGYMLLGYAIESITGRDYAEFFHSEFALPLGLVDTGVCGTSSLPLPEGYGLPQSTWTRMPALHTTVVLSAGGLCSTASDLTRWAHLLATGHVMLPASYATMTTPARLPNGTIVTSGYALGVATQNMLGQPAVWHSGAIDGYQSFLVHFPNHEIAVAVITTAFPTGPAGGNPQTIATAVAKAALPAP